MKTQFYTFDQNNSGGYFVEDDKHGVCEYVIIEAESERDACNKFEAIGDKVDGFWNACPCCGDRWTTYMPDHYDVPSLYSTPIENQTKGPFRQRAFVHYLDGTFKEFKFS